MAPGMIMPEGEHMDDGAEVLLDRSDFPKVISTKFKPKDAVLPDMKISFKVIRTDLGDGSASLFLFDSQDLPETQQVLVLTTPEPPEWVKTTDKPFVVRGKIHYMNNKLLWKPDIPKPIWWNLALDDALYRKLDGQYGVEVPADVLRPEERRQYKDDGKKWIGPSDELQKEKPVCPKCGGKGQVQAPDLPEGYMIPCPDCQGQKEQGAPKPRGPPPHYNVRDRVIIIGTMEVGIVIEAIDLPEGQKLKIEIEKDLGGSF